jgi:hypothetical protein
MQERATNKFKVPIVAPVAAPKLTSKVLAIGPISGAGAINVIAVAAVEITNVARTNHLKAGNSLDLILFSPLYLRISLTGALAVSVS